jgi:methionyl-tRNA formyltransferase
MKERKPARVLVLAEPEALFLPNCIAQLAHRHPLVAIVEVPPQPVRLAVRRGWNSFGGVTFAAIAASEITARVVDRLSRDRFYSLRKIAHRVGIPHERVSGLHAPDCYEAIERYRPDVIFTQLSARIRPELLDRGTFWNKHCGLLPAYAGVFPVFWALLHGERDLGVTVHEMNEEFDRGPILVQATIPANGHTFFSAYHALFDRVAPLLDGALRGERTEARPDLELSYFSFPSREDRRRFRANGLRFGFPFRLHAPVRLQPQA